MNNIRTPCNDSVFLLLVLIAPLFSIGFHFIVPSNFVAHPTPSNPYHLFIILILYPLLEELTFRGLIQTLILDHRIFRKDLFSISLANLIASLLFVLAHYLARGDPIVATVFVPSLVFGYLVERYRRLYPSIIMHSLYNTIHFILSYHILKFIKDSQSIGTGYQWRF
ncbi:MAG: JDVT-CTERM system CAAX-type protease [Magnetococcales bacterium]|nr:JDVT-CTERM system CAAX-type protease [Magnetococcales bacterium]